MPAVDTLVVVFSVRTGSILPGVWNSALRTIQNGVDSLHSLRDFGQVSGVFPSAWNIDQESVYQNSVKKRRTDNHRKGQPAPIFLAHVTMLKREEFPISQPGFSLLPAIKTEVRRHHRNIY
jgi:hypothetical protein